jgi:uncharacterized membrane protein YdbT with pleckstrin-like domain
VRYPTRLLTEDEEVLDQFRPHWKVVLPALLWAMLLAALGGLAVAVAGTEWTVAVAAIVVAVWALMTARTLVRWWFTHYVLTTERIIVRHGMIARSGREIPLENINNVVFEQRVMERLLGYGDVLVESASSQGRNRLADIPDPQGFQSEIYRARELRALHFSGGGARARDVVEQLESLAALRERGHLTDHEFATQKRRLLGALPGVDAAEVDELVRDELEG